MSQADSFRPSAADGRPALPSRTQVLVLGSGAGGAVTAATLAARGYEVVLLEEGSHVDTSLIATNSPEAIATLYRNGGITPIFGNQTIAYVEGRCVGGSTEVNSAFWHRLPADCYHRWRADALLADFSPEMMEPYFDELERELSVSCLSDSPLPPSSEVFRRGIERMNWRFTEVPRCQKSNTASPFAPGNKQSMQRTYIPKAVAAGARLFADCRVRRLRHAHGRVVGVEVQRGNDSTRLETISADFVFVCCGAIQTAALLRRSGIRKNVGNNLHLHPMIKMAALFDEEISGLQDLLPVFQVKEFAPNIAIGGSVFSPGFLAMLLSDNWRANRPLMRDWKRTALYYAAARGMNRGTIRVLPGVNDGVVVRYRLSHADQKNLSQGLAHLGEILFAAGARALFPSLRSQPVLRSVEQCRSFLKQPLPIGDMSLSTVHAFSSCPMGENPDISATDSFGKVNGFLNLYINDASLIPDSPGVNPQGSIMAIALRNADHFSAEKGVRQRLVARSRSQPRPSADILVTGAPGWLGSRFVELLAQGRLPVDLGRSGDGRGVRCLVRSEQDPAPLADLDPSIQVVMGDLTDASSVNDLCADADGAILFHLAGIVHPTRGVREFNEVNTEGTRRLLRAAIAGGVRRAVVVSSNSPFGFNASDGELFDEETPFNPYMGYGRSKHAMELLVREIQSEGNLETVVLRPPWFYGPHQPERQTVFFQMIRAGRFPILGDGSQLRSMAYVDNLCQALVLAAITPRANGETYWVADARPYSINEIVDTVQSVLQEELGLASTRPWVRLPKWIGDVAGFVDGSLQAAGVYQQKIHVLSEMGHSIACSIDKARRELGYDPKIELRQGMIESVRWCVENGVRF